MNSYHPPPHMFDSFGNIFVYNIHNRNYTYAGSLKEYDRNIIHYNNFLYSTDRNSLSKKRRTEFRKEPKIGLEKSGVHEKPIDGEAT